MSASSMYGHTPYKCYKVLRPWLSGLINLPLLETTKDNVKIMVVGQIPLADRDVPNYS
jgi:hypothetical protein